MLMLAAMVAHTLLRLPIGGLRQITTRFVDLDPGDQTLLDEAAALYNRYATQLQVTHDTVRCPSSCRPWRPYADGRRAGGAGAGAA